MNSAHLCPWTRTKWKRVELREFSAEAIRPLRADVLPRMSLWWILWGCGLLFCLLWCVCAPPTHTHTHSLPLRFVCVVHSLHPTVLSLQTLSLISVHNKSSRALSQELLLSSLSFFSSFCPLFSPPFFLQSPHVTLCFLLSAEERRLSPSPWLVSWFVFGNLFLLFSFFFCNFLSLYLALPALLTGARRLLEKRQRAAARLLCWKHKLWTTSTPNWNPFRKICSIWVVMVLNDSERRPYFMLLSNGKTNAAERTEGRTDILQVTFHNIWSLFLTESQSSGHQCIIYQSNERPSLWYIIEFI